MNKYALYEKAVQSPEWHSDFCQRVYRELRGGKYARHLREDFCGTFQVACAWVKRNRRNTALGLDLDPEPIAYGKRHHASELTAEQKKRLEIRRENVLNATDPRSDVIMAGNFSFCVFKARRELLEYFRACRRSLRPGGVIVLELAGGPGMIEVTKDRKPLRDGGKVVATYVWDQLEFDPVTRNGRYAIHFHLPAKAGRKGKRMKNAFTYDWRMWTIPEIRDALVDAGFAKTHVYWELEDEDTGEGSGEYQLAESGDNAYSWVAYLVGEKAVSRK